MGNIFIIEQNNPMNRVLNDIVDKDVQAMLLPLNMTHIMSFSPRYRIKGNRIAPNGFIFTLYSTIGALIFISSYGVRTYLLFQNKDQLGFTTFMTLTDFVDCIYYSVGFVNNFIIGIIQSKNNIKFVLLFQRVHRLLNDETSFSRFIMWNWIILITVLSGYFMIIFYFNFELGLPWFYFYLSYILVTFDFNILHAIRYHQLLIDKLNLWNIQVLNSIVTEERRGEDFNKRMFQAYVDILECYDILKVSFQPFIMFSITEVLLHSLIYIEVNIQMLKQGFQYNTRSTKIATLGAVSVLCWLVKNLMWQMMFMQRCETFYSAVLSVRDSCALILKSNCSGDERRLYKNVLRLHRASFSKMRVCGLFYADAALQLSLMSLLANYTIVLLQFAFL